MKSDASIQELSLFSDIEALSEEYYLKYGISPLNLSGWNPSSEFNNYMKSRFSRTEEIFHPNYIFSYSQNSDIKTQVLKKLSQNKDLKKGLLFTNSGSSSIYNVVHWLSKIGCESLAVVCPVYFTVPHACQNFGITCDLFFLERTSDTFILNESYFSEIAKYKYVWLTNPVYCTSVYYTEETINIIASLLDSGITVIADESLCENGKELLIKFCQYDNFVSIDSPHKSICYNGEKFSLVVFDPEFQDFFDQWADVLYGCLSLSSIRSIHNFLSDDFHRYYAILKKKNIETLLFITNLCQKYSIEYDINSQGYLVSLYFPWIEAKNGLDLIFLRNIIYNCEASIIPGARNHFNNDVGFSFRINLCADDVRFRITLEKVLRYLSSPAKY